MKEEKHPQQPLVFVDGVIRFKENKLVSFLLDTSKFDLNEIIRMKFSDEDYTQLMQLIGYSVCGFCDLNSPSEKEKDKAWKEMEKLSEKKKCSSS